MHRSVRVGLVLALVLVVAALAGCSSSASADSGASPSMKVWGYVASAKNAQLEVSESQSSDTVLTVDRVVTPGPAWLVVHLEKDGMPGDRVGLVHVDKGESTDVEVPVEGVTTPKVIVAVHADKGTLEEFDFDMMDKEASPDRPYFVDRKELAKVVEINR